MKKPMRILLFLICLLIYAAPLSAQIPRCWAHWQSTGGPFQDFERSTQLFDTTRHVPVVGITRTGWRMVQTCTPEDTARGFNFGQFDVAPLPLAFLAQNVSDYPRHQLDGARWAGRGLSSSIMLGGTAHWGPITAAIAPVFAFQSNDSFPVLLVQTPGIASLSDYFHAGRIDWPQRFGSSSFSQVYPGQSFIRADAYGAMVGFSTENLRIGPSRRNPLMMSNAGPGFPHVFAGTSKPIDLRIIEVGAEAIWGRLKESEYFDSLSFNDRRLIATLVITLSPKNSGLTIGLARSYLRTFPPGGLSLKEQLIDPYTNVRENPRDSTFADNQLLSAFFSFTGLASGLEVYGEYAREDHWSDANDLLLQLDHSRAYTFGLEKVFRLHGGEHLLRVNGEVANLGMAPTWQIGRPGAHFYTHARVRQGYTHRGQLLAAPIGPGSDAQYVGADYATGDWMAGAYYERVRYDNDVYYQNFASLRTNRGHDVEWTVGLRGAWLRGQNFQVTGALDISTRHNRDFVDIVQTGRFTNEQNVSFSLGGAWVPFVRRSFP